MAGARTACVFESDCIHFKVTQIVGVAVGAFLHEAVAMDFGQLVSWHAGSSVQAVHVLTD